MRARRRADAINQRAVRAFSPACSDEEMVGSVSSFAYQGTNSHALLASACALPLVCPPAWIWHRRRLWYQATSHPLLLHATRAPRLALGPAADVRLQGSLQRPVLAYLHDHHVQGRPAVPNTLLLEMASAAGQLLWSQESTDNTAAVAGAAFQQPLLLASAGQAVLTCTISPASGTVVVSSRESPTSQAAPVHMVAQLHAIQAVPQAEGTAPQAVLEQPSHSSCPSSSDMEAALIGGPPGAAGSASAAFATVTAQQHEHSSYWCHPAVADAALQLAAALQPPATNAPATPQPLLSAAVGAYAPMQRLAGPAAAAGAAAGLGRTSSHWLGGTTHQVLAIMGHQFKVLSALHNLAAALASTASQMPPLPAGLAASPAGMVPALSLLEPARVAGAAPGADVAAIAQQLAEVAAGVLGRSDIPTDQPLMEAGLDSIGKWRCRPDCAAALSLAALSPPTTCQAPLLFWLVQVLWSLRMP